MFYLCSHSFFFFFLVFGFLFFFFFFYFWFFILFIIFFFFLLIKFYFIFKLYIIVLVLPNIKMNPPQVFPFFLSSWVLFFFCCFTFLKRCDLKSGRIDSVFSLPVYPEVLACENSKCCFLKILNIWGILSLGNMEVVSCIQEKIILC